MEHKSIDGLAVKAGATGTAEVVIATIGVIDHDGDVVAPGAIGVQSVPILPAHNWASIPLGKARTREVGNQVIADLQFNLEIPEARSWHSALLFDVEHGPAVQEYSWGYHPTKHKPYEVEGRRARLLERVKLHEVSMVVQGASIGSRTVGVKCTECAASSHHEDDPELRRVLTDAKRHVDDYELAERKALAELERIYKGLLHAEQVELERQFDRFESKVIADRERAKGLRYYTACEHPDQVIARAGMACLQMCSAELGIEPPALSWMLPETAEERAYFETYGVRDWDYLPVDCAVYGAFHIATGRVWIRADLGFEQTMHYIAHEVRHAAGGDESQARAYQTEWASRLPNDDRSR